MRLRGRPSTGASGIWSIAIAAALVYGCGGDLLTLGRAPLEDGGGDAAPDGGAPDAASDSGSGQTDAGPPLVEEPRALGTINDGEATTDNPTLTADRLQIFFSSTRDTNGGPGSSNIWYASRTSTDDDFGSPVLLEGVNTDRPEMSPAISADGSQLWFARREGKEEEAPALDIYVADRVGENSWTNVRLIGTINSDFADIPRPPALVDGVWVMPMASRRTTAKYQTYFTTFSGTDWSEPEPLPELHSTDYENVDGFLRANGTEFYFSSDRDGTQDVYFVRASSSTAPLAQRFLAADVARLNLSQSAPNAVHKDPWVSEDGQWLYFTSDREDGREQIWEARLVPQ